LRARVSGVIYASNTKMSNPVVEELRQELMAAMSDHAESDQRVKDLAHEYRKALFGPNYENPESAGNTCSFCGKSEAKVEQLVAGPDSFICSECIKLSYELIHESSS